MTKLKTRKSLLKRIKITGQKKILKRKVNKGHFNAKESGNKTRCKRKDIQASSVETKKFKKILGI
ncbi:MAG: 50S ribosomal protein L35 [Candidatus Portnoybacteria bacterium]|nr:50S ribosomal protein L35 [Candidatus Portnoybacteria bacterium]